LLDTTFYLAALNLKGRSCLVVGAGPVGLEKIEGLLVCDARVTVVAPDVIPEVEDLARSRSITLHRRKFQGHDLDGCFLVISATSITELNESVYRAAEERSILVNVVDVPAMCNFILPAIVRSGPIAIAVSTAGASPALAKRMKGEIADLFGSEYAELALLLNEVREWAKTTLPTYQDRKAFFEGIVNGEPDPIALLRARDRTAVRARIDEAKRRWTKSSV
jgi:precorrin-2 dehydrogenase/sirohydrochlorin ferrochelatase